MDDDELREHFAPQESKSSSWSRWQLIAVAAVALMAVAIGMVWFYVLRTDERSTADIESQIEDWAEEKAKDAGAGNFVVTADCPDPVEWRIGETFNCVAKAAGETIGITVTMENDDGDVTWRAS